MNDSTVPSTDTPGKTAIAGAGTFYLDTNGEIRNEPDRNLDFHYNVTSLLASGCPGGCFTFHIVDIVYDVLFIELEIENPTSLQVWDVRLLYIDLAGKSVLNPDGYIDLFGYLFKPFTAFAKEYGNRAFPVGPGGTDTEMLELKWPAGKPAYVNYLIEVSLGGNCDEPYLVEGSVDPITTTGGLAIIHSKAYDWADDNMVCYADWSSLGGSVEEMQMTSEGHGFRGFILEIDVPAGLAPGLYPVILCAEEPVPKLLRIYNIIQAEVTENTEPINLSDDDVPTQLNFTSKTVNAWNDHIYVVWSEDITGDSKSEIMLKEFNGEWLDEVMVSSETFDLNIWSNPSIAVNQANGNVHVLWEGYADMNMAIGYNKRVGETWQDPNILFRGAFCMDSQIDVEDNDEVHIVLQDSDGPFLCIYWIHDPGTGVFADPFVLAEDISPMTPFYSPAIDHDNTGWVHVPFTTGMNGNNNVAYKRWNGTSWNALYYITNDFKSMWQDITVAPDRKATLIFRKNDTNDLAMRQWTGSWELTDHPVTSGAAIFGIPNIDADSNGNIHLAYCGESDGDRDIYYMVMDATSLVWTAPVNLSNNTSDSENPSLLVGSDDRVHIVWQDDLDGDWDVYYLEM